MFRALSTARKMSPFWFQTRRFVQLHLSIFHLAQWSYFKREGTRDTNNDSDFYLWIVFQSVTAFGADWTVNIEKQTTPNIISSISFSSVSGSIACWHSQGFCSPRKSSVLIKTILVLFVLMQATTGYKRNAWHNLKIDNLFVTNLITYPYVSVRASWSYEMGCHKYYYFKILLLLKSPKSKCSCRSSSNYIYRETVAYVAFSPNTEYGVGEKR